MRIVKTAGRRWRFGPWPISYAKSFDLGRWRVIWRECPRCRRENERFAALATPSHLEGERE